MSDSLPRCHMHMRLFNRSYQDRPFSPAPFPPPLVSGCARALTLLCLVTAWPHPTRAAIVLNDPQADPKDREKPGLAVPAPGTAAEPGRYDILELLNGDKLRGTFYSIDDKQGVRWRHPAIRQVLEVDPTSIGSIRLDRPQATNQAPQQTCLVRLTNEDELLGELLSVDATNVSLRTWYAGTLTIPRKMTTSIAPGQTINTALYEGPDGLEGWKQSPSSRVRGAQQGPGTPSGGWKFRNGAFYCAAGGSIGREMSLPGLSTIEFDLAWNGYLNLGFSFYTDNLENYGGNCYMLQFSSGSLYLQRMMKDGNSTNLGHSEAAMLAQKSKARVAIRSSKQEKNISLFLNGNLLKQWTDRGDFSPGTGIVFFHQGQGAVRVGNIRITEWDGKFKQDAKTDRPTKEDLVRLGNNDQITGSLKTIQDGKMSFGTEFATLEVPLSRIAEINLATEPAEKAERKPVDVRAVFAYRGSITFQLDRWDDRQVVGQSPNFGQVKFLPSAFSRIDFNLERQRPDPDLLDLDGFDSALPVFLEN